MYLPSLSTSTSRIVAHDRNREDILPGSSACRTGHAGADFYRRIFNRYNNLKSRLRRRPVVIGLFPISVTSPLSTASGAHPLPADCRARLMMSVSST
jgi:hypothetical protein